jgi:anti-sigma B factor antagonist
MWEELMDLDVSANVVQGRALLTVAGEVDIATGPRVRQAVIDLLDEGVRDLVIDLRQVSFLDSSGLGVLVGALRRLKGRDGALRLVCSGETILKTFRLTGLGRVFTTLADVPAGWPDEVSTPRRRVRSIRLDDPASVAGMSALAPNLAGGS